ncbi:periplasmic sensor signal transduction histidine kinase [Anaeromyxobacter dehalogenans 2CP-C]|uniref:histidine kinase n=1 Tax=Anaeromyxobacter dehalogenans (strain 2CP-C) TaxID=290397 RepID=Q2II98_ANADE|nr:periplasmic sensor signal transduction histidine kinase [Anaeromyxobacter dehalogenans 2CP-C]
MAQGEIAAGDLAAAAGTAPHPNRSPARSAAAVERGRLNLSWLVQLHWWAILGQATIVVGAQSWTHFGLPMGTLVAVMVLEVIGNIVLGAWARRAEVTDRDIALVMLIDAVVLTVLLDLTGGASNPFSTLYLVNVALAAVLLPSAWSWLLMAASLTGFASLFVHEHFAGVSHHIRTHMDHAQTMAAHLRGMWVAFALAAVFVVFFVQRVTRALAAREGELQAARSQALRREKLASLATLAAGAAHELSTPLSTIAVVAKELQRAIPADASSELHDDLQLVRDQVARCREILDRMAAHAGENVGEPFAQMRARDWVDAALDGFRWPQRVEVRIDPSAQAAALVGPQRGLAEALRGLLKNAVQASPPDAQVTLLVTAPPGRIQVTVRDRGRGMTPDVLSRVGEPFFTTKVPGEGMGLGLFLTRALAEQLGGEFNITSTPGDGTEARIELPVSTAGERSSP